MLADMLLMMTGKQRHEKNGGKTLKLHEQIGLRKMKLPAFPMPVAIFTIYPLSNS